MSVADVDQFWVADITYIRSKDEFVFLAVILDACSRRVIGWALERTLVHHSSRGSQYGSTDYTDLLKAQGLDISVSRKANPWDNAACESFMKSLKYEEVLRNEYRATVTAMRRFRVAASSNWFSVSSWVWPATCAADYSWQECDHRRSTQGLNIRF
jgi:transposase InsO family protein